MCSLQQPNTGELVAGRRITIMCNCRVDVRCAADASQAYQAEHYRKSKCFWVQNVASSRFRSNPPINSKASWLSSECLRHLLGSQYRSSTSIPHQVRVGATAPFRKRCRKSQWRQAGASAPTPLRSGANGREAAITPNKAPVAGNLVTYSPRIGMLFFLPLNCGIAEVAPCDGFANFARKIYAVETEPFFIVPAAMRSTKTRGKPIAMLAFAAWLLYKQPPDSKRKPMRGKYHAGLQRYREGKAAEAEQLAQAARHQTARIEANIAVGASWPRSLAPRKRTRPRPAGTWKRSLEGRG